MILTTQGVNGAILRSPDQAIYSCGDTVTLTAQPDPGATFVGWGCVGRGTTTATASSRNGFGGPSAACLATPGTG
ncbi:MAG: InlB B-repeat-containing protein, partial [Polyangiales bacterium]